MSSKTIKPQAGGAPFKTLACLTAAVALVHLIFLQGTSLALHVDAHGVARPFTTRAITLNPIMPPQPAAAALLPVVALEAPPRRQNPRPPARPSPANAPTVISEANTATEATGQAQPATDSVAILPPEPARTDVPPATETSANTSPDAAVASNQAAAPPAAPPEPEIGYTVPGSARMSYKVLGFVKSMNWNLDGELLWLQEGIGYDARLTLGAMLLGTKTYTSTGQVGSQGLAPTRFGEKFRSAEVAAHFEREKQKISFSANTPSAPLLPGMQDWLSALMQVGSMLAAAPTLYPAGTKLSFETVGARSVETSVFVVEGQEILKLPGGEVGAVKLTRGPRNEFDQTIELWLAPSMAYLPVRIKLSERSGDFADMQWRANLTP